MEKIFICLFIVILIMIFGILTKDTTVPEVSAAEDNFVYIDFQAVDDLRVYRFYDKNTKVIYMFVKNVVYQNSTGGLTVMLNEKGEPLLYE